MVCNYRSSDVEIFPQIWNVQKRHLICLESMPKLHRLQVEGWDERLQIEPFIFKPLDSHSVGLQFLHVFLPKETSLSLIAAHGQTLKVLLIYITEILTTNLLISLF